MALPDLAEYTGNFPSTVTLLVIPVPCFFIVLYFSSCPCFYFLCSLLSTINLFSLSYIIRLRFILLLPVTCLIVFFFLIFFLYLYLLQRCFSSRFKFTAYSFLHIFHPVFRLLASPLLTSLTLTLMTSSPLTHKEKKKRMPGRHLSSYAQKYSFLAWFLESFFSYCDLT